MIWFILICTFLVLSAVLFTPLMSPWSKIGSKRYFVICTLLFLCGALVYAWTGRPELTAPKVQASLKAQYNFSQGRLSQALEGYEILLALYPNDTNIRSQYDTMLSDLSQVRPAHLQKIQQTGDLKHILTTTNSTDVVKWQNLASLQMELGDYNGALESFQTAVNLAPNDESLQDAYDKTRNFIDTQKRAANMTAEEQKAMFENMTEGLAVRLYDEGGTPAEWIRLIRSRKTLGQSTQLAQDIEKIKTVFADNPEVLNEILGTSQ